jgi:Rrf2 family nitric oxide-sensitive transcriptional repressor
MFKLNKKLEYALIALKHIAEASVERKVSAREISDTYATPFDTTSRVLQIMVSNQFLLAEHGVQGGYSLNTDLDKVSFFELAEAILGPIRLADCLSKGSQCSVLEQCNILTPVSRLNQRLIEFCENMSISEILNIQKSGNTGPVAKEYISE